MSTKLKLLYVIIILNIMQISKILLMLPSLAEGKKLGGFELQRK